MGFYTDNLKHYEKTYHIAFYFEVIQITNLTVVLKPIIINSNTALQNDHKKRVSKMFRCTLITILTANTFSIVLLTKLNKQ